MNLSPDFITGFAYLSNCKIGKSRGTPGFQFKRLEEKKFANLGVQFKGCKSRGK